MCCVLAFGDSYTPAAIKQLLQEAQSAMREALVLSFVPHHIRAIKPLSANSKIYFSVLVKTKNVIWPKEDGPSDIILLSPTKHCCCLWCSVKLTELSRGNTGTTLHKSCYSVQVIVSDVYGLRRK